MYAHKLTVRDDSEACSRRCVKTLQVRDVAGMNWGMNTDVEAVFKLIYKKAVKASLAPADMVKTLFIFSVCALSPPRARLPIRDPCWHSDAACVHAPLFMAAACLSCCVVPRRGLRSGSRGGCAYEHAGSEVSALLRRTWSSIRPHGWTRTASAGRPRHRQTSRRRRLASRCCHPLEPRDF